MTIVNITVTNDADFYRTFIWQTMMLRRHASDKAAVLRLATDTGEITFVAPLAGQFTVRIKQETLERLGLGDFDQSNIYTRNTYKVKVWEGLLTNNAGATR
jgi:hypothetical protein